MRGRKKGSLNFQVATYYSGELRDKEYDRLKSKGFDMGVKWDVLPTRFISRTLYCFKYRLLFGGGGSA